ncbi:class I SAM-dependent methyltransferase [uncultured Hymenobacter sp.]|uniref:class I SAM-dependent methyltransferase n=1 Tax=uncultured Hymenobacter sp. TaxID=170016 RepID=UPI0035CBC864
MKYLLSSCMLTVGGALALLACTQLPAETNPVQLSGQAMTSLTAPTPPAATDTTGYQTRPARDPNGIGRYYLGRQIAHVMGHEGASWLERSDRQQEEGTDILLRELKLKPTDVVADIGAGTGFFSFRMAKLVPRGQVLAVDIQPEMIAELERNKRASQAPNVRPVLGTTSDPKLPAGSVDLALIVDAYHEFDHPREMGQAIRAALRPGTGRLALVEYRAEDPSVPIKQIHKMSVAQARKEMAAVGLEFVEVIESLPQQHLLIFRRK